MYGLLDINNTFFTVFGYPMSYIEFFGTILNLLCVWLVAKKNIWNWPIGIVGVVLFTFLFYQIRLYSDMIEQVYYFITGFYGWWIWLKLGRENQNSDNIKYNDQKHNLIWLAVIAIGTVIFGYFTARLHIYWPQFFTEPASFPYLDAFTTVMSFVAQILLAYKRVESWMLWVAVDVIGVVLYFQKGVILVSILYFIFLIIATQGLLEWIRSAKAKTVPDPERTNL